MHIFDLSTFLIGDLRSLYHDIQQNIRFNIIDLDKYLQEYNTLSPVFDSVTNVHINLTAIGNSQLTTNSAGARLAKMRDYLRTELNIEDKELCDILIASLFSKITAVECGKDDCINFIFAVLHIINCKYLPTIFEEHTGVNRESFKFRGTGDVTPAIKYNSETHTVSLSFSDGINIFQKGYDGNITVGNIFYSITFHSALKIQPEIKCILHIPEHVAVVVDEIVIYPAQILQEHFNFTSRVKRKVELVGHEIHSRLDKISDLEEKKRTLDNIIFTDTTGEIAEGAMFMLVTAQCNGFVLDEYALSLYEQFLRDKIEHNQNKKSIFCFVNAYFILSYKLMPKVLTRQSYRYLISKDKLKDTKNEYIKEQFVQKDCVGRNNDDDIEPSNDLFMDFGRHGVRINEENAVSYPQNSKADFLIFLRKHFPADIFDSEHFSIITQRYTQTTACASMFLYPRFIQTGITAVFMISRNEISVKAQSITWDFNAKPSENIAETIALFPGSIIVDTILAPGEHSSNLHYRVDKGIYVSNYILELYLLGKDIPVDEDVALFASTEEQLHYVIENPEYNELSRKIAKFVVQKICAFIDTRLESNEFINWLGLVNILDAARNNVFEGDHNALYALILGNDFADIPYKTSFLKSQRQLQQILMQNSKVGNLQDLSILLCSINKIVLYFFQCQQSGKTINAQEYFSLDSSSLEDRKQLLFILDNCHFYTQIQLLQYQYLYNGILQYPSVNGDRLITQIQMHKLDEIVQSICLLRNSIDKDEAHLMMVVDHSIAIGTVGVMQGHVVEQITPEHKQHNSRHLLFKIAIEKFMLWWKEYPQQPPAILENLIWRISGGGTTILSVVAKYLPPKQLARAVQISEDVEGVPLSIIFNGSSNGDVPRPDKLKFLDMESFTRQFLRVLLLNFANDSEKSYVLARVQDSDGAITYKLICINNGWAFCDTKSSISILYCFDQMFDHLNLSVLDEFLRLQVKEVIHSWLQDLNLISARYSMIFSEHEFSQHFFAQDPCDSFLAFPISKERLQQFQERFETLQDLCRIILRDVRLVTGIELLQTLQPHLAILCEKLFAKFPCKSNPGLVMKRFQELQQFSKINKKMPSHTAISNMLALSETHFYEIARSIRWGAQYSPMQACAELEKQTQVSIESIAAKVLVGEFKGYLDLADHEKKRVIQYYQLQQQSIDKFNALMPLTVAQRTKLLTAAQNCHHMSHLKKELTNLRFGPFTSEQKKNILTAMCEISVRELNLSYFADELTDAILKKLLQRSRKQLISLDLRDYLQLNIKTFSHIAQYCPNLKILYVCTPISNKPRTLEINAPKLHKLQVERCPQLNKCTINSKESECELVFIGCAGMEASEVLKVKKIVGSTSDGNQLNFASYCKFNMHDKANLGHINLIPIDRRQLYTDILNILSNSKHELCNAVLSAVAYDLPGFFLANPKIAAASPCFFELNFLIAICKNAKEHFVAKDSIEYIQRLCSSHEMISFYLNHLLKHEVDCVNKEVGLGLILAYMIINKCNIRIWKYRPELVDGLQVSYVLMEHIGNIANTDEVLNILFTNESQLEVLLPWENTFELKVNLQRIENLYAQCKLLPQKNVLQQVENKISCIEPASKVITFNIEDFILRVIQSAQDYYALLLPKFNEFQELNKVLISSCIQSKEQLLSFVTTFFGKLGWQVTTMPNEIRTDREFKLLFSQCINFSQFQDVWGKMTGDLTAAQFQHIEAFFSKRGFIFENKQIVAITVNTPIVLKLNEDVNKILLLLSHATPLCALKYALEKIPIIFRKFVNGLIRDCKCFDVDNTGEHSSTIAEIVELSGYNKLSNLINIILGFIHSIIDECRAMMLSHVEINSNQVNAFNELLEESVRCKMHDLYLELWRTIPAELSLKSSYSNQELFTLFAKSKPRECYDFISRIHSRQFLSSIYAHKSVYEFFINCSKKLQCDVIGAKAEFETVKTNSVSPLRLLSLFTAMKNKSSLRALPTLHSFAKNAENQSKDFLLGFYPEEILPKFPLGI